MNKPKGYLRVSFWGKDKKRVDKYVHILVAKMFVKNTKRLQFVNHKDGNKTNNHFTNLEWVTAKQNTKHAYEIGKMHAKHGEDNPFCKLTDKDIKTIRQSYSGKRGEKSKLALQFGVSATHILRILSGQSRNGRIQYKIWSHLERFGLVMQEETKFKNRLVPRLRALPHSWILKTQEVARSGTPDILMCLSGIFICIEIKTDKGKVSKLQDYNLKRIAVAGGVALVIQPSNLDASIKFLENIAKEGIKNEQCSSTKKGSKRDKN